MRSRRFALIVAALALVAGTPGAHAAEPDGKPTAAGNKAAAPKPGGKSKPAADQAPPVDPSTLRAVLRQKDTFMVAAESCARKETCSPELLKDAEKRFVAACEACAPADRCEEERQQILGGTATRLSNPCAPAAK